SPEGFDVKLWASEKDMLDGEADKGIAGLGGKPIAMNWDERGRLWVCETVDYPNELQVPGKGLDRIRVCEDTNGDGKADKFTVFASQMSIPTAIAAYLGGVLVQDGTKTVYLKDTDGDDVADMKQELITGWAMGDTHGGVSNFQYGLDNWIWAMQGYNDSYPVINGEKQQGFRQGFWRFALEQSPSSSTAPVYAIAKDGSTDKTATSKFDSHSLRVSKLEFIRSTNNNTWGFGISEEGLIFGSTANGNPSIFMPIPNRYYERVTGWSPQVLSNIADGFKFEPVTENVRQVDWHGGYTAAAGHALYTARNYPKHWWNRLAFVCEPTGHLVGSFVLSRDGAGYRSTSPFNLVASNDEWAAPIMAEVGPDGNIWVLDWYNFIVQHNPTPQGFETGKGNAYETKLRDKRYGRVYRVVYNGSEGMSTEELSRGDALVRGGLVKANESSIVAALQHPNMFWRRAAQRLLVEKSKLEPATFAALESLVKNKNVDDAGLNVGAIHAIWVLAAHGKWSSNLVAAAMHHPSAGVVRNAVAAALPNEGTAAQILDAKLLGAEDAQVKLAALLKLADCPAGSPGVAEAILASSASATDRWLLDAWTSAAATHAADLLPRFASQKDSVSNELAGRLTIVAEHAARNKLKADSMAALIESKSNPQVISCVISGLVRGWPKDYRIELSDKTSDAFVANWLSGDLPLDVKGQVIQLAGSLGVRKLEEAVGKIRTELLTMVNDNQLDPAQRLAAAKQMILLEPTSERVLESLLSQVNAQSTPDFAAGMVAALGGSKVNGLVGKLLVQSQSMPPDFLRNSIRMILGRPEMTRELIEAIEGGKLSVNDLQLDQRQLLRDHPDAKIREKAIAMMKNSGGI
ncbi:MAG: glycosyl hydrolase, partial [Planctomycetes bacterium]|nr:glycosyl hydrolase [Planctomycetota bacterium]